MLVECLDVFLQEGDCKDVVTCPYQLLLEIILLVLVREGIRIIVTGFVALCGQPFLSTPVFIAAPHSQTFQWGP
jgi:hypothetical protein